ncbi:MAG: methionine adenosyltransferase [Nitrosopumilaceae archaeon]
MSPRIFVESVKCIPTFEKRFEIVERKGIGHPDTICDLVMNQISIELSKTYLKETGKIQHHNMDKSMLVAGQSENKFGGGNITKPMKLIIGDRATFEVNRKKIPVEELSISIAKKWFEKNLRYVKDEHIEYQLELGTSSHELRSIFENPKSFVSNDTSALVGYAPFTKTESAVLETEQYINSEKFKKEFPESGEDAKVMGFRNKNNLEIIIAMAFVDSYVYSEKNYFKRKEEMLQTISEFHKKSSFDKIEISMNNLDVINKGIGGLYLTVLGTSADNADSGEVGRGNMANRVISLSRPAGSEATAGKNPVSHIGKIYNALSFKISEEIQKTLPEIDEVLVWMYNIIGKPVKEPRAVVVQPISNKNLDLSKIESTIKEIVDKNLDNIDQFCMQLSVGKIDVI